MPLIRPGGRYNYMNSDKQLVPEDIIDSLAVCNPTVPPATDSPAGSLIPDGSAPNTIHPNVSKEGKKYLCLIHNN